MITSDWAEISCEVPAAMVDAVAAFLVELTGCGVSVENLQLDTFSLDSVEDSPVKQVKGYLPLDGSLEEARSKVERFLAEEGPSFPGFVFVPPAVSTIRSEDWANNWKAHFKPVRIGRHLIIKPTWEEYAPEEGDLVIQIDPGMAFGTGAHPTTRMCLEALERIASEEGGGRLPERVLDVGTGSGVLSIAAALMGAVGIVAVDIDPEAVEVTRENLELNGLDDRVAVSTTALAEVEGSFGVVLANILAEELVRLAAQLAATVEEGGWLILSGILTEKAPAVAAAYPGFILVDHPQEAEWSCLVLRRE